jgi:thiol:disulfide interchange protein
MKDDLLKDLFEWLMDVKTLLAALFIAVMIFWLWGGKPERLLNMADQILTAVFSLAIGYRLGKANAAPPVPPEPKP